MCAVFLVVTSSVGDIEVGIAVLIAAKKELDACANSCTSDISFSSEYELITFKILELITSIFHPALRLARDFHTFEKPETLKSSREAFEVSSSQYYSRVSQTKTPRKCLIFSSSMIAVLSMSLWLSTIIRILRCVTVSPQGKSLGTGQYRCIISRFLARSHARSIVLPCLMWGRITIPNYGCV